jgi:hypothetical protein
VLNLDGCEEVTTNGLHSLVRGLLYVRLAGTFMGFVPKDTAVLEKFEDIQSALEETAAIRFQNGLMRRFNKRCVRVRPGHTPPPPPRHTHKPPSVPLIDTYIPHLSTRSLPLDPTAGAARTSCACACTWRRR